MKGYVGSGDCEFWWLVVSNMSNISSTIFTKLLPLGCLGHLVARVALRSLPLLAGQVMICLLSCQIVRCQATWHTLPCWCARQISLPESKHRMNAKQHKTLTAAHGVSFRRSEIADLPRDRQSGEPQRSQKELRNCQPIKANAKLFSHILHGLLHPTTTKCIQTLETLDFDNKRTASGLMKIHPFCKVLILSQDPHHSVLICLFCQLFANLPYQGTPRNLHCSAAVNPGDGFAPSGGMPAAAGRNTFYISPNLKIAHLIHKLIHPCLTDGVWICILQLHKISYTPILPTSRQYKENQRIKTTSKCWRYSFIRPW